MKSVDGTPSRQFCKEKNRKNHISTKVNVFTQMGRPSSILESTNSSLRPMMFSVSSQVPVTVGAGSQTGVWKDLQTTGACIRLQQSVP